MLVVLHKKVVLWDALGHVTGQSSGCVLNNNQAIFATYRDPPCACRASTSCFICILFMYLFGWKCHYITVTIQSYIMLLFTAIPNSRLYTQMADRAKSEYRRWLKLGPVWPFILMTLYFTDSTYKTIALPDTMPSSSSQYTSGVNTESGKPTKSGGVLYSLRESCSRAQSG